MSAPQAQQSHVHPRRRPLKTAVPSLPSSSDSQDPTSPCPPSMRLRKAETFHSPTSPSEDRDPVLSIPSLPRRSPTCPRSLEAIAAGEQRMAGILDRFDLGSLSTSTKPHDDDLPVPRGILQAHVGRTDAMDMRPDTTQVNRTHGLLSPPMDQPEKFPRHRPQLSDSGLGSSISSSAALHASGRSGQVKAGHMSVDSLKRGSTETYKTQSAITGSISSDITSPQRFQLSMTACKKIERLILVPILKEDKLKPFHALVKSVPQRIASKEIACLRDLEKTLLWLAPASYLGFCEFSIQCIHTAVSHLNDREQRLPTDRPYTNGYFLDLVAQIRQYAAMMAASRERARARRASTQPSEEVNGDHDGERLTLEGGLSQNGRPAELVCHKDGKAISLRTGEPYEDNAVPAFKRSLSTESLDDGVIRSMARRKKNAPPMDINQKCKDCDKVFKRPCDLTKHEKTHSRPWKCSEPSCKYFEVGWPTEKERDRHVNDKHSSAPALYKCSFAPCTYQSKRESNCKQHMEKAHGWVYVRSKNNGKTVKKGSTPSSIPQTPSLPQTPAMPTPISNPTDHLSTPMTGPAPSPFEPVMGYPSDPPFSFVDPPSASNEDFQLFPDNSTYGDQTSAGLDDFGPFTSEDFEAFRAQLEAAPRNELLQATDIHRPSFDSTGTATDSMGAPGIFDASPLTSTDSSINFDIDWSNISGNMDGEYTTMNMQLLTPDGSVEAHAMNSFSRNPSICNASPLAPQECKISSLSPGGQGNLMLYSPYSNHVDAAFPDLYTCGWGDKPVNDFTLYENGGRAGGNFAGAARPSDLHTVQESNQMFPPLNAANHERLGDHAWAGRDFNSSNFNNGMMDLDDYLG
ncbi:C2H2 type zinc finger domain protein [Paecilomyces variotii No. 5]|uniref:C2H2 type zinc finger domain protein n=1 Tax=Byssochlamys spectabilis (strain No. 5 / NBRC 109023) TaxID=1356009 RepID=V5G5I0_BYSSN|nr:C2H2 type zinc finger domain protein [Paecilomyces variotii No. 5]